LIDNCPGGLENKNSILQNKVSLERPPISLNSAGFNDKIKIGKPMYFSECHNIPESKANNELDYEGNSRFERGGI